jgi:hypothetical protein
LRLPRTVASTLVQPRVTATSLAPATLTTSRLAKWPLFGFEVTTPAPTREQAGTARPVARDPVGVSRRLEVELVLNHDRPVERFALVELGEQQLEEVVLDLGRFRFAREDGTEGRRRFAPEGDLLQADEVRFLAEDLFRQAFGAQREVRRFDRADDAAVGLDERFGRGRLDRRRQVGAQVEVARHHFDGRAFGRLRGGGTGERREQRGDGEQRHEDPAGRCGCFGQARFLLVVRASQAAALRTRNKR